HLRDPWTALTLLSPRAHDRSLRLLENRTRPYSLLCRNENDRGASVPNPQLDFAARDPHHSCHHDHNFPGGNETAIEQSPSAAPDLNLKGCFCDGKLVD